LDIDEGSEEAPFRAAIAGGLTGIAVAAALARTREIEAATSTAFELASLWGTWFPIASTLTLDADPDGDAVLTAAVLGGNAALIGAARGSGTRISTACSGGRGAPPLTSKAACSRGRV
jgi:hypothetical protein